MKAKPFALVVAAAVTVCALCAAIGAGTAGAADRAQTEVTIASWDRGLVGIVKSTDRCSSGRKIKVFRQRGDHQDPKGDKAIGTATARKRHRIYQWSLNKGNSGSFYAKAGKRGGCRPAFSDTYTIAPHGTVPLCPSHQEVCQLDQIHVQLKAIQGFPCPADFSDGTLGLCGGNAVTGRGWGGVSNSVGFSWFTADKVQSVTYGSSGFGNREPYGGKLSGLVPVGTKAFYVFNAENSKDDFFYTDWYTPSTPGVAPGDQGGPLYLDYTPGNVVIRGYLYNTCNFGCE